MQTSFAAQDWPVLVVDDDPDVACLLGHIFRRSGLEHPILAARDTAEAIRSLHELALEAGAGRRNLPLFILVDLKLPRTSGFELLAWLQLRPDFKAVPRIVMSCSVDQKDIERAYLLGANGFLAKYPSPATFATIARFARQSQETGDPACLVLAGLRDRITPA